MKNAHKLILIFFSALLLPACWENTGPNDQATQDRIRACSLEAGKVFLAQHTVCLYGCSDTCGETCGEGMDGEAVACRGFCGMACDADCKSQGLLKLQTEQEACE